MEAASKVARWAWKVANSDASISLGLAAAFALLVARSVDQQRDIKALEAEKASLTLSNSLLKRSIWSSKQALFDDYDATSALVPLARLKAIYGEASEDNSPESKLVV